MLYFHLLMLQVIIFVVLISSLQVNLPCPELGAWTGDYHGPLSAIAKFCHANANAASFTNTAYCVSCRYRYWCIWCICYLTACWECLVCNSNESMPPPSAMLLQAQECLACNSHNPPPPPPPPPPTGVLSRSYCHSWSASAPCCKECGTLPSKCCLLDRRAEVLLLRDILWLLAQHFIQHVLPLTSGTGIQLGCEPVPHFRRCGCPMPTLVKPLWSISIPDRGNVIVLGL